MTTLETTQHQKTPLNSRLSGVPLKQLLPILLSLGQRLVFGIVVLLVISYLSFSVSKWRAAHRLTPRSWMV